MAEIIFSERNRSKSSSAAMANSGISLANSKHEHLRPLLQSLGRRELCFPCLDLQLDGAQYQSLLPLVSSSKRGMGRSQKYVFWSRELLSDLRNPNWNLSPRERSRSLTTSPTFKTSGKNWIYSLKIHRHVPPAVSNSGSPWRKRGYSVFWLA